MIRNRRQAVDRIVAAVQAGRNVEVVGRRRSGKTTVLQEVARRLSDLEFRVLSISGSPSQTNQGLSALRLSMSLKREVPTDDLFVVAQRALAEKLAHERAVMVLDHVVDIDDVSWALIERAVQESGRPAVFIGPLQPDGARRLHTRALPLVVELNEMSYDSTVELCEQELGGPIDVSVVNKVFANSGGIIGDAVVMLRGAHDAGRLEFTDGTWSAAGILCSPLEDRYVIEALRALPENLQEAVRTIGLMSPLELSVAEELVSKEDLRQLEDLGVVMLTDLDDELGIELQRPLISAHLRAHWDNYRTRSVLADFDKLHDDARPSRTADVLAAWQREASFADPHERRRRLVRPRGERELEDGRMIRLIRERTRLQITRRQQLWNENPTGDNALAYVHSLRVDIANLPLIKEVLSATDWTREEGPVHAEALILRSRAELDDGMPVDEVATWLDQHADAIGPYGGFLRAEAVVQTAIRRGPKAARALGVPVDDGHPDAVREAWHAVDALLCAMEGHFDRAMELTGLVTQNSHRQSAALAGFVEIYAMLLRGQPEEAVDLAKARMSDARAGLNLMTFRTQGFIAGLGAASIGRASECESILSQVIAVGMPAFEVLPTQTGSLLTRGLSTTHAQPELASYLRQAETIGHPSLPIIGAWPPWSRGIGLENVKGREEESRELIRQSGLDAAAVGAWPAALWMWNADPWAATDPRVRPLLAEGLSHLDGSAFDCTVEMLELTARREAGALRDLAERLPRQPMIAIRSYLSAACLYRQADRPDAARECRALARRVADERGLHLDQDDGHPESVLTARELEVARYAASGDSNPAIADELGISVRTVETHLRQVFLKLGVRQRDELVDALA